MDEYPKINTIFKRDPTGKTILWGDWSQIEFGYLKNNLWEFTEKVDGMNIRVCYTGGAVRFAGKTDAAQLPKDLVATLERLFPPEKLQAEFAATDVTLYGEGYGAGIQKGGVYRPDKSFALFDVRIGPWWLVRFDVEEMAERLGVEVVPLVGEGTLSDLIDIVPSLQSTWGEFPAEGVVARPSVELKARNGTRIITKLKRVDFKNGGPDGSA